MLCWYKVFYLNFLHSNNLTHTDLKPENVLVFEEGGAPVLRLGDFQISRILEKVESTKTDCGLYKAPEITPDGKEYRKEVDVWSLGLVLHFLLTGKDRFQDRQEVLDFTETLPHFRTGERLFHGEEVAIVEQLVKQMIHPD